MKYPDNIREIAGLKPDYLGFIFYDRSPRYFEGDMPEVPREIKKTGVFVNATVREIAEKVGRFGLQAVQLHGGETAAYCRELREALPGTEIIKVFSVKDKFDFGQLFPFEDTADYFLFDTRGKHPGGNGYTFDWKVLKDYPSGKPFFLSGGIGPEEGNNVLEFLSSPEYGNVAGLCHAVDVNSRFETAPGYKNTGKLKEFKSKILCQHQ
ncbi:phosphoribosylanthranilate isomerase [Sinomicrobium soli]|uniref:phosphoribosylanthranilate isomerase n=1 Tax=Sinomicrobium sp. N-1-3-6 TaxID=2219864 RepID=UPI000DCD191F|nr:phosphoribosylanthranilate isomerase [Sinomicrobium sp. N-1-3-6]RAV29946.1 phosphoribosylanthranilate isomerase [Sinomicrobium sp. N-1-3-6]